ncbi:MULTISPECIES: type IV pilus secretin PilQ family protein [unclassified Pseudoxanthomonas]|uniref:type IV pilus secretin PilQ n=1 Tax=unclassified Pseudoxanthomonas TaxID=2645906 RepID=UPI0008E01C35|nr:MULTISPECIES: type IV pilus secretin PilQ family protein [unclassified Pseudoxanthomonas]PPJ43252.1 type IV pilus secretin PilQ [Pseudoxanthomonas sp. KAs_5_3]SFV34599.1 type IV pilus assembly protein PilQ [Pseudoxanthomonas sp. YR558]
MTASNAYRLRPSRRLATLRACSLGLAIGLLAAASAAGATPPGEQANVPTASAKTVQAVSVSNIDFRRGEDGAGRLIVKFDGQGASPDLRNQGDSIVVDVGNATLPASLQRPLNVVDFATPVQRVEAQSKGGGTQLVLSTRGEFESLAYQSGNEYVVEIVPRAGQKAVGGAGASAGTSSSAIVAAAQKVASEARRYSGRPVTFNFQDVPVRTVLQLIAEESNLNIVASDTVQGNVTLRLVNVPWDQALDIVLRAKGLDKRRDGNVVWVAPQPELAKFEQDKEDARIAIENREDLITDYVQVNYHSASAIFKALTEAKGVGNGGGGGGGNSGNSQNENGFLSQRGRLVADERTNTLMISDIPKKVAQMRELIAVIDRPVDQVIIEGRIVIATDTFARDLGARFGISGRRSGDRTQIIGGNIVDNVNVGNGEDRVLPRDMNVNLPASGFIDNTAASIAYTLLGRNFDLDLELSALQEEGRGEVISNPRLVTTNQREAVIKQGREVGYLTVTGSGTGTNSVPTVQFKEALLELKVLPTITDDNRVFLNLNVKKDEVVQFVDLGIYGSVPELARREINTAVLIEDGQTVVIGGVYEFSDRASVAKVPFLGDIPFLGNLFKKKGRSKEKAELLIFVTPKVLRVAERR